MDEKLFKFHMVIREAFAILLAGYEDYLGIPYDKSVLARRRSKVRENG